MSHHFHIDDLVNPGDFFPDFGRWDLLHRNCVGRITAVAADGQVTVDWNPYGSRRQIGIYLPNQVEPASRC